MKVQKPTLLENIHTHRSLSEDRRITLAAVIGTLSILGSLLFCAFIYREHLYQARFQNERIEGLSKEIEDLKSFIDYESSRGSRNRARREIDDYQDDEANPIVVDSKYFDTSKNATFKSSEGTEGLRIYGAWFGKKGRQRGRNRQSTRSPIKKHHRTSAVWAENKRKFYKNNNTKLNAHFGRNIQHRRAYHKTSTKQTLSMNRMRGNQFNGANNQRPNEIRASNNRGSLRSLSAGRSIQSKFDGLKAVHFVGERRGPSNPKEYGGESRVKNGDGLFLNWFPARWASRMRVDRSFPVNNGTVRVSSPGVYYIYAQINYLDEHDVNAFQIYKNDDPLFLCTSMTHTPHSTTKANTCFTSGVVYLEQGDSVFVRDLEPGRYSVLLPSHTFFGLVQISGIVI